MLLMMMIDVHTGRVHSKLKGQNSRTFEGLSRTQNCSFQVPKVSIKRYIILALDQNLQ